MLHAREYPLSQTFVLHMLVSVNISENYLPKAQSIRTYVQILTILGEPTA